MKEEGACETGTEELYLHHFQTCELLDVASNRDG
jgi:hypothetical protein